MTKPLFPKSVRKHIRLQKARIRREVSDSAKRQELIGQLVEKFGRGPDKPEQKPRNVLAKKKEEVVAAAKEK